MKEKIGEKRFIIGCILFIGILILVIQNFASVVGMASKAGNVMYPLILGAVIAYVLNILMTRIEKYYFRKTKNIWIQKSKRMVCIVLSILLVIGILALVVGLVVPELVQAFVVIAEGIPVYYDKLNEWLLGYSDQFPVIEEYILSLEIDWQQVMKNIIAYATSGVTGILNSTISVVSVVAGGVINFLIALIFAIYLLTSKEKLSRQIKQILRAYVSQEKIKKLEHVTEIANSTFSSFIIGQCTEAVILGSLCTVGMMICGFPYAPMTGAFIGVTALIPVVGAYLGAAVGGFMILTVDPVMAALFLVFIVILQQLEGNLIYPRVVGSSVGLPALWVLAAVTVGGGLGGIVGMLFGVPVAGTIYKLVRNDVKNRNHDVKTPVPKPVPQKEKAPKAVAKK